jgi:hypothetical protein
VGGIYTVHIGDDEYTVLLAIPEGKTPLGRPKHRWDDNIKTYVEG